MIYQCWSEDGGTELSFFEAGRKDHLAMLGDDAELLYQIQAPTWEDACKKHHEKQGWEPYVPMSES